MWLYLMKYRTEQKEKWKDRYMIKKWLDEYICLMEELEWKSAGEVLVWIKSL